MPAGPTSVRPKNVGIVLRMGDLLLTCFLVERPMANRWPKPLGVVLWEEKGVSFDLQQPDPRVALQTQIATRS